MSKMTRKIAAIIAAAMTATTMGAMNAFADADVVAKVESSDVTKTGSINLKLHNNPEAVPASVKTPTWYITVVAADLVWEVKTTSTAPVLSWDGEQYQLGTASIPTTTFDTENQNNIKANTGENDEDRYDKSATITNKSNFNITAISQSLDATAVDLFSIQSSNLTNEGTPIGKAGTFNVTIRPNVSAINTYLGTHSFDDTQVMAVGKVDLTFTGDTTNVFVN